MKKRIVKSSVSACLAVLMTCEMGAMDVASVQAATANLPRKQNVVSVQQEQTADEAQTAVNETQAVTEQTQTTETEEAATEQASLYEVVDTEEIHAEGASQTEGYFTYHEDNGMACVDKYTGSTVQNVTIPTTLGGLQVGSIAEEAFKDHTEIVTVTLPDTITYIGERAFAGNTALTSIHLPDSLETMARSIFAGCTLLKEITIPASIKKAYGHNYGASTYSGPFVDSSIEKAVIADGAKTVPNYLFNGVPSLKEISLPDTITSIGEYAFAVTSIPQFVLPDAITYIGEGAFAYNAQLSSIHLPDSLEIIGRSVFRDCTLLKEITIPASIKEAYGHNYGISTYSGPFVDSSIEKAVIADGAKTVPNYLFNGVTGLKEISLPDTITSIGEYAFAVTSIPQFVLPDAITYIGEGAFAYNAQLSSIHLPDSLETMARSVFRDCTLLKEITIPANLNKAYGSNYGASNYSGPFVDSSIEKAVIADGALTVPDYLFNGAVGLKEVTLSDTITKIGEYAFSLTDITRIIIPDAVTSIGEGAFRYCKSLTQVTLGAGVESIGYAAFADDVVLADINLPVGLKDIRREAFLNCTALKQITIPITLEKADAYSYDSKEHANGPFQNSGLEKVTFDDAMDYIPEYLFAGAANLKEVTLPKNVTEIHTGAFAATGLTQVDIPEFVTFIGEGAFANCASLEKVTFDDALVEIRYAAFLNDAKLTNVALPQNLVKLKRCAFKGCTAITEITIPAALDEADAYGYGSDAEGPFAGTGLTTVRFAEGTTEISKYLFVGAKTLTQVEIPESVVEIEYAAFANSGLTSVTIPESVVKIGEGAFANATALTSVTMSNNVTEIGSSAFEGDEKLDNIQLSTALEKIEYKTFYNNKALKMINIPDSVTAIETQAFSNSGLTEITIPKSVTRHGDSLFENTPLKKVVLNGTGDITYHMFNGCKYLTDVTVSKGVKNIGREAFTGCTQLKEIVFPYGLQEIARAAFSKCTALTSVTLPRTVKTIADDVFSYPARITLTGIAGTYVQDYASAKNIKFVNKEVEATTVELNKTEWNVVLDKNTYTVREQLELTVLPYDFTDDVVWTTSNADVAEVDATGNVSVKRAGDAVITVSVGEISATCKVHVEQRVTNVRVSYNNVEAGETYTPYISIYPSDATNPELKFTSMDPSIIQIDESGKITGVSKGKTTIVVSTTDGSNINVYAEVETLNNRYVVTKVEDLESNHNDANNNRDEWEYTLEGAKKLKVTFDEKTNLENFAYLRIFNVNRADYNRDYTGTGLAGKSVYIMGDTVKLKMYDRAGNVGYGFKVASVEEVIPTAKLTADKTSVGIGDEVTFTANVDDETLYYCYDYAVYNEQTGEWDVIAENEYDQSYQHAFDKAGTYKVRVSAKTADDMQPYATSEEITVQVANNLEVSAKLSASKVATGGKVTVTATASRGTGSYTYRYLLYNPSNKGWTQLQGYSDKSTYTWTASGVGARHLYVEVKDKDGTIVRSKASGVNVLSKPAVTAKISTSKIAAGDKVTITATASQGSGKYTYRYLLYNPSNKGWTQLQGYSTKNTYTWTASGVGARHLYVEVKDSNGTVTRSAASGVNVLSKPTVTAKISAAKVAAGDKVTITASASQGSGKYTYRYLLYNPANKGWTQLQAYGAKNTYTWTASGVGVRHLYVEVKDSNGTVTRSKASGVTLVSKPAVTAKISKSKVATGDKVTITASASQGSGKYTYRYLLYNPANKGWTQLQGYSAKNTYTWTASGVGARHLYVEVKDSNGMVTRSKASGVTVVSKPTVTAKLRSGIKKVTITATASQGSGQYAYRYIMYNPETKAWTQLQGYSASNTYTWKFAGTGVRHLYAEVKDSNGTVARSNACGVKIAK